MYESTNLGAIGEAFVVGWLRAKGYIIDVWDTKLPGSCDIDCHSSDRRLLVQVKTAIQPNEPAFLSSEEAEKLRSRASNNYAEAWEARVFLRDTKTLTKDIVWRAIK